MEEVLWKLDFDKQRCESFEEMINCKASSNSGYLLINRQERQKFIARVAEHVSVVVVCMVIGKVNAGGKVLIHMPPRGDTRIKKQ